MRTDRVSYVVSSLALVVAGMLLAGPAAATAPRHSSPIQVTDDGSIVWVANPDSDSLGKINTTTNMLVGEYPVGDNPRTLALDSGWVYVTNQGSQDLTPKPNPETVMQVSQANGSVQNTFTLPFGCAPYGVVVNENASGGPEVYVSCERTQQIVVLDASLTTVHATVPLDWPDPRAMAISADRTRVYVAHFLTREPGRNAHVSEIDTTTNPPHVVRVIDIPPDETTCETINSGKGAMNLLMGIHLIPPGAPAGIAGQLWVGGVLQNHLTKGLFKNDTRFGGHADPLLCTGGPKNGKRCTKDKDCGKGGHCTASFTAVSRNLYKVSFHDVTRFIIAKIDLATGQTVGKVDVDEANQGTDLVFSADGTTAYTVDQFFNSLHIFNTARGQGGDPTTVFASPSHFGPGGVDPTKDCTGGSFLTASELPFIRAPQAQLVPIAPDPVYVAGGVAFTGNDYDVTTGQMHAVPDSVGTVPHGVALHPDGTKVYVANFLSRNVVAVKADSFFCPNGNACMSRLDCNGCAPRVIAVIPSINTPDPLPPQLLDGKILFHTAARDSSVPNGIGLDAAAPLFNRDDPDVLEPVGAVVSTSHDASYVACISCHPEGGFDGRSWDFSQFGASVRNSMDLRGRSSFAPGVCSDNANVSCTTDSQCGNNGVGTCSNDGSVVCELDIQCGKCAANSPTPGITCIADRQCGGVCSNNNQLTCTADGECGGFCREDGTTPCTTDSDCSFGCKLTNACAFFACETQPCNAAKCLPADLANVPRNITNPARFMNPMMTVHWNGDRDEVEDFEFTFRSLMGAGDCDGVEDLPDKCIGALVMRSNVAKPQEANPDLGAQNRGLSPRLDHMADYVYSLTSFVRNPNLAAGPSADAVEGAKIFFSSTTRCAECHNGPSPTNQHFSDKHPDASYPLGQQGRSDGPNPFLRHNVGTFNAFDLADPFDVAGDIGQFQNAVLPIPGSRGALLDYITPTLVDVWNTAPFNHDGSFATLMHGITPCNSALDDCTKPDAGKNINDQHGTTSNLTPRQLRLLEEFLDAPHNAAGGSVRFANPFTRLVKVLVTFGPEASDDRFSLKARFRLPVSSSLDVVPMMQGTKMIKVLDEPITIALADVDEPYFERTVPAGKLVANKAVTGFTFGDPTLLTGPGIRRVSIQLVDAANREYQVFVLGRALDLSLLDKNHITVSVEVGDDDFVKTRTFKQKSPKRKSIKVVEP